MSLASPEKEARRMTQNAEEEEKHVMAENKMAAKCVFFFVFFKNWGEEREIETWHCGMIENEKRRIMTRISGTWRNDGKNEWREPDGEKKRQEKGEEEMADRSVRLLFPSLRFAGLIWGSLERQSHTRRHTHTHCPELIQVLIFSIKDILRLGMGGKFIYCFSTWTTSFSPPPLLPTVDKREIPTKPITHLSSLQPGRSCWTSPSFSLCPPFSVYVCQRVCICASSCLLNIIGISAGGLIKKQLPLVAVGDAWRRVARLIWWMVWGTLSVQHTHKHAHKLCNCLQN